MASAGATAGARRHEIDPLRWAWRLLTSVRFALGLIAFMAGAALAGVLIPQLPAQIRGNDAAIDAWLALQDERFGFLTGTMSALGLFEMFRSVWFVSALGLLVASVCVCTANRVGPVWRNVTQPQMRVPDEYFGRGATAMEVASATAVAAELRRRRYRVSATADGGATYLFADRCPWAQLATFVSHLALILFLAGGFVTLITAKEAQVLAGEGETRPVFAPGAADHMQIAVEDAVGRFDGTGFPLDFRSYLVVYKDGREVARGVTTVNDPLRYAGFNFHQSAYFADGAALRVREAGSGRVVYSEVLALTSFAPTPRVEVRDRGGSLILDDAIVPTDFLPDAAGTVVALPGHAVWIGARRLSDDGPWQMIVFETDDRHGLRTVLAEGEQARLGELTLRFAGIADLPSLRINGLPGGDGSTIVELSSGPRGDLLNVGQIAGRALALSPGEPVVVGDYEYTFLGRREFAGITVRRDPGSRLIWVATSVFLLGLALTFYTPRRRLWVRLAGGRAAFRGLGGRAKAIEREIGEIAARANEAAADREGRDA